jgi:hypothetical protein
VVAFTSKESIVSLQDEIDKVDQLGGNLLRSDASVRKQATIELTKILKAADPRIMAAFTINTLPQLARAIQSEQQNDILLEMVWLAREIGPGEPAVLEALVEKMKDSSLHKVHRALGGFILDTICEMGVPARLFAIKGSHGMDAFTRIGLVAHLTVGAALGSLSAQEPIHGPVSVLLSESPNPSDWECLCELSHIFAGKVPRGDLRRALVKVWRKADGVLKKDIAYTLRRRGFVRLGSWWL